MGTAWERALTALTLCALAGWTDAAEKPPQTRVPRLPAPPAIDGRLDDAAWKQAARLSAFRLIRTGAPATAPTDAFVGRDDRWLYVGARCHDAQLAQLVANVRARDGGVMDDDSLEFFVDPGTGGRVYCQFVLNAANTQADRLVTRQGVDTAWDAAWTSAVFCDPLLPENGWSVEMAIPLAVLRQHAGAGEWRMNLCRNKRTEPREASSWAFAPLTFHSPEVFGVALGLKDGAAPERFLPSLLRARAARYCVENGRLGYGVIVEVANDGKRGGQAGLVVEDREAGTPRAASQTSATADLKGAETREVRVFVPADRPGPRAALVRLVDKGKEIQTADVAEMDALSPLSAYLDRNYYTTEETARVFACTSLTAAERQATGLGARARLLDAGGKELQNRDAPASSAETALALDLRALAPGERVVEVAAVTRQGAALGLVRVTLRKLAPAASGVAEVKIDQENRCLLVDGKPFFPVGICVSDFSPEAMQEYHDLGFNTIIRWGMGAGNNHPASLAVEGLDAARAKGIRVIESPLSFLKTALGSAKARTPAGLAQAAAEAPDFIRVVRGHPALLAYYGLDEAPEQQLGDGLRAFYAAIRDNDPYHPLYFSGSSSSRHANYAYADILGRHAYWCELGFPPRDTPNAVAGPLDWAYANASEPNRRPLFFMPQAEMTSASRRPHGPAQRRVTVYMGLIHGAKSMIYWRGPLFHAATPASMKELSAEINAMAPALVRRSPPQELRVTPAPGGGAAIAHALYKESAEGYGLLLAANASAREVGVEWDLAALGKEVRVEDFFGRKARETRGGVFTDKLAGYGARAYRVLNARRIGDEPVVIAARLSGPAVAGAGGAAGAPRPKARRNMLLNSSFEESGAAPWPDGWFLSLAGPGFMVGDPKGSGMDDRAAVHGRYSFRLANPTPNRNTLARMRYIHEFASSSRRGGIPVEKGKSYVFSAWMKASREGAPARIILCNMLQNQPRLSEGVTLPVKLATEWKRYEVALTVPEQGWRILDGPWLNIWIQNDGADCNVWVDAIQLEAGEKATEYEPDGAPAPRAGKP